MANFFKKKKIFYGLNGYISEKFKITLIKKC